MTVSMRSFAAVMLVALAASCNTPGHVKAVRTASRLDELSTSVEELRTSATATSTTLAALLAKKDQDAAQAFQQFESAVHDFESGHRHVEGRLRGVREEADAYFLTWKERAATIDDQDLKEQSEDRRAELAKAVDKVEESMKPAREALDAYQASLNDTLKYLSIDLTPSGISSIDGRVKAANKSVKSVNEKLGDVLEAVKKAQPLFATAHAAPAPRKNGNTSSSSTSSEPN